jgi:hypothetical protein
MTQHAPFDVTSITGADVATVAHRPPGRRGRPGMVLGLVALLTALGIGIGSMAPPAANASAYGYDYWGKHVVKGVPVPSGQLFGAVEGSGTRIDRAGGDFLSAGNICNWSISIVFYNNRNKIARVVNQDRQRNCRHAGIYKLSFGGWHAPEGRVCIRLYRDFGRERLASVCHSIHR